MKYIRTTGGKIIKILKEGIDDFGKYGMVNKEDCIRNYDDLKQADTIEELICDDDILYIYDLYPDAVLVVEGNIKPFGYRTAIKLKEWLNYIPHKFDLFIKDSEGNYIKRATTNDKGKLELL